MVALSFPSFKHTRCLLPPPPPLLFLLLGWLKWERVDGLMTTQCCSSVLPEYCLEVLVLPDSSPVFFELYRISKGMINNKGGRSGVT